MDKTTKQRLASYRALRLEVDNQLDRLARLRNEEQIPAMQESSGAKVHRWKRGRMEKGHPPGAWSTKRELRLRSRRQKREMAAIEAAIDPCGGSAREGVLEAEIHRWGWIQDDSVE